MKSKTVFLYFNALLLFLTLGLAVFYAQNPHSQESGLTITFSQEGFTPKEFRIEQGNTIVFKTNQKKPFWPASDLHPTHSIYPEFDPGEPIEAYSSWSFTFTKVGEWTFHNHLFPSQRGKIIVSGKDGFIGEDQISCKLKPDQARCWAETIDSILEKQGLEMAFKKVEELYSAEPKFAADCHGFVHKLGETAYTLYSQGRGVPFSTVSSYCGYGFYHGFMENLFVYTNDMIQAGNFCNLVYEKQNIVSGDACYHGLGHGAEAVAVSDPSVWGNPRQMFSEALAVCGTASREDPIRFSRCASGVFMEASVYYSQGIYQLTLDKKDPFSLCRIQEDKVKMACYTQLYPVLKVLADGNLAKAASFVEQIKEDNYAMEAMETLSGSMMNVQAEYHKQDIAICRGIQDRLRLRCIKGLALGFLLNGSPGKEFVQTSEFCLRSGMKEDEIKACYDITLRHLSGLYSGIQVQQYCNIIPLDYRNDVCK